MEGLRGAAAGLAGIVENPRTKSSAREFLDDVNEVRDELEESLALPVLVENNTRLAAIAEATWGAARAYDDALYIRLADGVSAGIVESGTQIRGAHGMAGELGHVVVDRWGKRCYCGAYGCLETILGLPALVAECNRRGISVTSGQDLIKVVNAGDLRARGVVEEALERLIPLVMTVVTMTDPGVIVIGGELSDLGNLITERIRAALGREVLPAIERHVDVCIATLGVDSAALGAVALLMRQARGVPETETESG